MPEISPPEHEGPSRRQVLLAGGAAAGVTWAAPAVLRVDRAAAELASCIDQTIAWTSVAGTNPWTATAVSGDITITVQVIANTTGIGETYLSGGLLIQRMRNGHSIGDFFDTTITFSHASGTICQASSRVLDLDQNGRGPALGCASNSRFRDELSNLTGAGLTLATEGNLAQVSAGVYASTLNCKTTDTENLAMTWTDGSGVAGGGFRWTAATPPGNNPTLDLQLIKLTPFIVCATGAGGAVAARQVQSSLTAKDVD
jgi:hypothetical protein